MFSDKLTCAIRMMNILHENSLHSDSRKVGLNSTQLLQMLDVEMVLYRAVKSRLLKEGLLHVKGERITLGEDAPDVNIMQLMTIFHAGLPIGSSIKTDLNKRGYLFDIRYKSLRDLEYRMESILSEQLEKIFVLEVCDSSWSECEAKAIIDL